MNTQVQYSNTHNGKATASMVLGILGLFIAYIPFLGLIVTVIGLILSCFGLKSQNRGMAIAGLVMNILGVIGAFFITILMVIGISLSTALQ